MSRRFAKQTTRSSVILMLAAVTLLGATACGGSNPGQAKFKTVVTSRHRVGRRVKESDLA